MKKFILVLLVFPFVALAQNQADYNINVILNPVTKTLDGVQKLKWTNNTPHAARSLQFHLYLNAFKDDNSTFFKESGGMLRGDKMDTTQRRNFGNIYLTSFKSINGENLLSKIKFIQPDDSNIFDRTVFEVVLQKPVLPGQSVELDMSFKAKLPKIFARTGWARDDYFMVGQWFPKIGVFENNGQWNCHQFHAHTEFFSDFGSYNVNITLPKNFKVAATGQLITEKKLKNNLKTLTYTAQKVHDFAWAASPHFMVSEKKHRGIKIMVFNQPEHQQLTERYFESAIHAIDYMHQHVGAYPHPTLSLIDPTLAASGSGGMEYPMLITCGSYWGAGKNLRLQEAVTIHEFVHQYFQGMVASNEFENSWMDEGFTQYFEGKIMEKYYQGNQIDLLGFRINDMASSRYSYISMPYPEITEVRRNAWQYPSGTYNIMSYTKTATWLKTLEGLLGEKNMMILMKTYFERWKFKHPQPQDFIDVANEIASKHTPNKDLNWFFDQVLFRAPECDYTVGNITNAPRKMKPYGYFTAYRKGDMTMPVEIKVMFQDNTFQMVHWDGKTTHRRYRFSKKIKYVHLDPHYKNWMDLNLINNSVSVQDPTKFAAKYATKVLFWVQNVLLG